MDKTLCDALVLMPANEGKILKNREHHEYPQTLSRGKGRQQPAPRNEVCSAKQRVNIEGFNDQEACEGTVFCSGIQPKTL
jgi:hypothetical protein